MKFIHAADIHLGNAINGIDRKINLPVEIKKQISLATFDAFANVIKLAIDRHVDFILFPGDLFDSSQQSAYLYNFLNLQFQKLKDAGIEAFISFGNHDFQSDAEKDLLWPDNIHVFPKGEAKVFYHESWDGKRIAITGTSFAVRNPRESLVKLYPNRDQSVKYEIGMYHGNLGDTKGNGYAPFSVPELQALNYDYWALGHIHVRQLLSKDPAIVYSGDPQGLDLTETGEKGIYLISDENQERGLSAEFLPTSSFIFDHLSLSIEDSAEVSKIFELIIDYLKQRNSQKLTLNTLEIKFSLPISQKIREQLSDASFLDLINAKTAAAKQLLIRINLITDEKKSSFSQLDERYWQLAKEEVFKSDTFNQALGKNFRSNEQFVIKHFTNSDVQAQIMKKAEELISERIN
ncbi:DNA repair exonuclease [Oenococcus sicerae]|uniref:DNA repair exonuclease n=1 Tax=Oenococcus sicerae TaxID=2203724 RepID=A0AAJ1VLM1_9LACO|nr:DNA repair exonuclease [Oenococcus sicerae]MDN6899633.1 DNA repair exonuclease [Oenococcus sicerae]QAS70321.1 DNA repair exonuclease [Oenococcus sicerae]VDK13488.1 putative metallophosphoesterase YhaO [Oenococcus sicerae]